MKIDLVYTVVNPDDPVLLAQKQQYARAENKLGDNYSAGPVRYRSNGELLQSMECAWRYLPFLNHIYVVYAGTAPSWLSPNEKLSLISQDDLVPTGIAPTFQSDVVESFIYRIPGLSEHYLYSNDDYFFCKEHRPSDFFDAGGRAHVAVCHSWMAMIEGDAEYVAAQVNSVRAIQRRLRVTQPVIVREGRRLMGLNHPRQQLRALTRGMRLLNNTTHVTQPYLKSRWSGFHDVFANELRRLCSTRFRSSSGYTVNLMYHHYLRSIGLADFRYDPNHRYMDRRYPVEAREELRAALLEEGSTISQFCLNDAPGMSDDRWEQYISMLMNDLRQLASPRPLLLDPAARSNPEPAFSHAA